MATPPKVGTVDSMPVGDPVTEWDSEAVSDQSPLTGPDLLAAAAEVLPSVVGPGPVLTVDLHAALYHATDLLGVPRDRWQRLRLAEEAHDLFAAYLVVGRHVARGARTTDTVRGWLCGQDVLMVQLALAAAGGHWRREPGDSPPLGSDR